DAREELRGFLKAHDMGVAGLAQGVFQDRRPGRILVDDGDLERGLHGRMRQFSSLVPKPRRYGFLSFINSLQLPTPLADRPAGSPAVVQSWAIAPSARAAGARRSLMSTGALSASGRIAPLWRADFPDAPLVRPRGEEGAARMRFHADLHVHSKYSRATSR